MYRYSVPCNPRITLAAFLAHFFLQDYREGAAPFAPAGRFQSTCPRRGTTIPESKLEDSDDWFQSTLPRGERRRSGRTIFRPGYVSIHAPTRGATLPVIQPYLLHRVSIHAPTRGATHSSLSISRHIWVSIHAPTRGATKGGVKCVVQDRFQSTLPRGERLPGNRFRFFSGGFNPRSHEGSDDWCPGADPTLWVSIHAPTRGAT